MNKLKIGILGVLSLVVLIGIGIAFDLGGLFYKKETAEFRGKSHAEEQIESADSRIQHYQEFFNLCQSIQTKEDAIDNLKHNTTMEEKHKGIAITSNQNARASLIAEYNSKSAQLYTAARFKSSNLPYTIPRGIYTGRNKTICVQ